MGRPHKNQDISTAIGNDLRGFREFLGMTQQEFGTLLGGITYQQVQKYESGESRLSLERLFTLCRNTGIDATTILPDLLPDRDNTADALAGHNDRSLHTALPRLYRQLRSMHDQRMQTKIIMILRILTNP